MQVPSERHTQALRHRSTVHIFWSLFGFESFYTTTGKQNKLL